MIGGITHMWLATRHCYGGSSTGVMNKQATYMYCRLLRTKRIHQYNTKNRTTTTTCCHCGYSSLATNTIQRQFLQVEPWKNKLLSIRDTDKRRAFIEQTIGQSLLSNTSMAYEMIKSLPNVHDHVDLSPNMHNLIIQILASRKMMKEAWAHFKLFTTTVLDGAELLTPATYCVLLRELLSRGMLREVDEVSLKIPQLNIDNESLANIYSALIDGYSNLGLFDQCEAVFDRCTRANNAVLISIVNAYGKEQLKKFATRDSRQFYSIDFSEIQTLIQKMEAKIGGGALSADVCSPLIQIFATLPFSYENYEAILQLYKWYIIPRVSMSGRLIMEAYRIFASWPHDLLVGLLDLDDKPNWSSIVTIFLSNYKTAHVRAMLSYIESKRYFPPLRVLNLILVFYGTKPKHLKLAEEFLTDFVRKYNYVPSTPLFNMFLQSFIANAHNIGSVEEYARDSIERYELEVDQTSHRLMLQAYGKMNAYDSALTYIQRIKQSGFRLVSSITSTLIQILLERNQHDYLWAVLKEMDVIDSEILDTFARHYAITENNPEFADAELSKIEKDFGAMRSASCIYALVQSYLKSSNVLEASRQLQLLVDRAFQVEPDNTDDLNAFRHMISWAKRAEMRDIAKHWSGQLAIYRSKR